MKVFYVALLLALIGTSQAFQQLACLGATFSQMVISPSPLNCNQYVACFQGQTEIGHCNTGRHFNARTQQCGPAGTIDCTQCGPNGIVNLPHPTVCQRYFECMFGWRTERLCPNGLLFDRRAGACNRANLVNCGPLEPNPPLNPPPNQQWPVCVIGGQVHHGHPTDCSLFFQCDSNGIRHLRSCPPNHHWSERRMACDTIANARCFR